MWAAAGFLADPTALIMIGHWHHNVVCLSVRPSVCDAVHLWLNDNPTAKGCEEVNRKCHPMNTTVQLSIVTPSPSPQNPL